MVARIAVCLIKSIIGPAVDTGGVRLSIVPAISGKAVQANLVPAIRLHHAEQHQRRLFYRRAISAISLQLRTLLTLHAVCDRPTVDRRRAE